MIVRRRGRVVHAFDPVANLFADIAPCVLFSVELEGAARQRGLAVFRATWFDGSTTRWLQIIAIPVERASETLNEWFGSARSDDDADADTTLVVCPGHRGERPVIMTAARIHDGALDRAQYEAEEFMAASLRVLLPARRREVSS